MPTKDCPLATLASVHGARRTPWPAWEGMKAWRARTMPSCGAFFHAEKVTAAGTHCSGHRCVGMIANNPDARRAGCTGVKPESMARACCGGPVLHAWAARVERRDLHAVRGAPVRRAAAAFGSHQSSAGRVRRRGGPLLRAARGGDEHASDSGGGGRGNNGGSWGSEGGGGGGGGGERPSALPWACLLMVRCPDT